MNDTLVATSADTYPYRTYLTMVLSYGRDAKATWLRRLEGWQMDKDGNYIAQEKNWPDLSAKTESHVCIKEAIPEICKVKIAPSKQLCLENVLTILGTEYPLANVVTKHFTLAAGASTWMLCSPDKSLPRSSLAYWPMKPLMASGKRIPSNTQSFTFLYRLGEPAADQLCGHLELGISERHTQPCRAAVLRWHLWLQWRSHTLAYIN